MKTTCCKLLLTLTLLVGIGTVARADFAAIVYSPQTGRWAYAAGYKDLAACQNNALDRCGTIDARIPVWVENGWAALARTENGAYGWAWSGNSRAEAEANALKNAGAGATIVCWVFSGS